MNPQILIYVAGKYNGNISKNIAKAEKVSIELIKNKFNVITPHKNTSHYEFVDDLDEKTIFDMGLNILLRCDLLYVLDNWETSPGTKKEILFAIKHKIPILYEDQISPQKLSIMLNNFD